MGPQGVWSVELVYLPRLMLLGVLTPDGNVGEVALTLKPVHSVSSSVSLTPPKSAWTSLRTFQERL